MRSKIQRCVCDKNCETRILWMTLTSHSSSINFCGLRFPFFLFCFSEYFVQSENECEEFIFWCNDFGTDRCYFIIARKYFAFFAFILWKYQWWWTSLVSIQRNGNKIYGTFFCCSTWIFRQNGFSENTKKNPVKHKTFLRFECRLQQFTFHFYRYF